MEISSDNYKFKTVLHSEVSELNSGNLTSTELLNNAKERLLELSLEPGRHSFLSDLSPEDARYIADQIKNSFSYAHGILGYYDRETVLSLP
jgi:hypothetical protein